MAQLDNVKIGSFIASLRREKGLTQQQLAENVGVSNKAVSKWERGLSLPDVALLPSLAEALGITVTELLKGERVDTSAPMPLGEVEQLVTGTLSIQTEQGPDPCRGPWLRRWGSGLAAGVAVLLLGSALTHKTLLQLMQGVNGCNLILSMAFGVVFGLYTCFLPAKLPAYYDENKIYVYSNRFARMHLPIALNNRNWTAIRRSILHSSLVLMTVLPVLWFAAEAVIPQKYLVAKQIVGTAVVLLVLLVPMIVAGTRADRQQNKQ